MLRLLKFASHIPAFTACTALFALMLLTFADVMLRSILNAPIQAGADLTRLLMAVVVFSVMPVLSFRGGHISVDLLDPLFDRFNVARWRDVLVNIVCGVMLIWPCQRIWVLAERSRSYGDVMEYLQIPVHFLVWFITAMTAITAVALIARGVVLAVRPHMLERSHD